ncbi:MAG: hypothetical protein IVW51_08410 [Thermaceae bacterium]|nr:hypothetical protein [Thermaceae bacterium]
MEEDHLELWNPGGLPPEITVEGLRRRGHPSQRRNPLIAGAPAPPG